LCLLAKLVEHRESTHIQRESAAREIGGDGGRISAKLFGVEQLRFSLVQVRHNLLGNGECPHFLRNEE
jgi:hypothetical protein